MKKSESKEPGAKAYMSVEDSTPRTLGPQTSNETLRNQGQNMTIKCHDCNPKGLGSLRLKSIALFPPGRSAAAGGRGAGA